MSSRDVSAARRVAAAAFCALAALALGGCFRPLYAGAAGASVADELRAIDVKPVQGRLGHYVVDDLALELDGTGEPAAAKYSLEVTLKESQRTPTADSVTGRATSATTVVVATYRLLQPGVEAPLVAGRAIETADYDLFAQRFANLRAQRDAEIRAARSIAGQVSTRLAAYFATRRGPA
ncbi:MAG: hypothetical protein KGI57_03120 [Hyphomicrobiales bacterium]|nr:hypothetical protein [Hyphomicrobiales bacterium]MDE2016679.1 hypothetical protein [Hyphomicrobiales bacterium]